MIFAMNGILAEIFERVVHPSHIPLEAKAEAADDRRAGNHGPRSRFLRGGLNVWMLFVGFLIESAQEFDGLQVFTAAEFIGNPLALLRE